MTTWTALLPPRLHCEGWGPIQATAGTIAEEHCDGGTGVWVTRRARWVRSDGLHQCGTCKRRDVARVAAAA